MQDILSVALRALSFMLLLQAAGVALFVTIFGRLLAGARGAIGRLGRWSALLGLVCVVGHYALEAARMAGDLSGIWDFSLQRMVFNSATGAAFAIHLADGCYDDDTCELLSELDDTAGKYGTLTTLEAAAQQVGPYVDGFIAASRTAEQSLTADPDPTLPAQLHGTATADQILRIGLTGSDYARRNSPPRVAQAQNFIVLRTIIETNRMDNKHTAWLKDVVARGGWPKASDVGATGRHGL